ncbi:MAG: TonB-dependent receptor [Gammaproteobacteria bacterium]|nr:TonB-dependent receptor [Gammaproteobacteria bacterium]
MIATLSLRCQSALARNMLLLLAATTVTTPLQAGTALEEVVVTAQRREENLQDVPIAVTAFAAELIHDADVHDLTEISARTPGLTYAEFAPGQAYMSIRGVTSGDDGAGMDNSAVMFLDDIYIGRVGSVMFNLADIERIEVLRGPQGTLYGKNAIGGAINVTTTKPTDEFTALVDVTGGNYATANVTGLVSGPLTGNLSGKAVINHRRHDGYVTNVVLDKDQQDEDVTTGRVALRWASGNTEINISGDGSRERREDMGRRPIFDGFAPVTAIYASLTDDFNEVAAPIDGHSDRDTYGTALKLTHDFDLGRLTAIFGYRGYENDWEMASVGVPLIAAGDINDKIIEEGDSYQVEFRWDQELTDRISYVAGLFYLNEQTSRVETFLFQLPPQIIADADTSDQDNETNSYAMFGQMHVGVTTRFSLDIGARFTYENKDTVSSAIAGPGFLDIIGETFTDIERSEFWTNFSPKLSLNYAYTDDVLFYVSYSEGFKSGGIQGSPGRVSDARNTVEPELAVNYEWGMKADLFDDRVRFNVTAFVTDYSDLQIVRFGPPLSDPTQFGSFQTTNAADADLKGVELEVNWLATENLLLSGNYAYLDATYEDFIFYDTTNTAVDLTGERLIAAPEHSWAFALDYTYPLQWQGSSLKFRLDYRHTDEQRNDVLSRETVAEAFDLVDLRFAWRSADEKVEVALWGRNVFDEEYITESYIVGPGVIGVGNAPPTFGGQVSWRY